MRFRDEAWQLRNQRSAFTRCLLRRINKGWTEITRVRGRWPGHNRLTYSAGRTNLNTTPTSFDRQRLSLLVRAWRRDLADDYLNLQRVRSLAANRGTTIRDAYAQINDRSPRGAVRSIFDDLNHCREPVFIGPRLFDGWSYNTYLNYLLAWDDLHCYGLLRELMVQQGRYGLGGGSSIHPVWQAARNWLFLHRDQGVYSGYGIPNHRPVWDD